MAESGSELDETDKQVLAFIEENQGFAGTAEVAEELGLTTNGAEYRLKKLEKAKEISSRVVSRDKVWYKEGRITADGGSYLRFWWEAAIGLFALLTVGGGVAGMLFSLGNATTGLQVALLSVLIAWVVALVVLIVGLDRRHPETIERWWVGRKAQSAFRWFRRELA